MEIIVEIGDDSQKDFIINELSVIKELQSKLDLPINISKLIVPIDFDCTVRNLSGDADYNSIRTGEIVMAKVLYDGDETTVVFSPWLYQEDNDNVTRFFLYFHEVWHVINHWRFPRPFNLTNSGVMNFKHIYILYDEYYCNRTALRLLDLIFPIKTKIFLKKFFLIIKTFYNYLISATNEYKHIQILIDDFRNHGDVNRHLEDIYYYFDSFSKSIVHLFSYVDHFEKYHKLTSIIERSPFVNFRSIELINLFRKKWEEDSIDLTEDLHIMDTYMLNFGIKYEDTLEGLYCHIIDLE